MRRVWGNISVNEEYGYAEGVVFTPEGIVEVFTHVGDGVRQITLLRMVKKGFVYAERIEKKYSVRGLSVVAHRFAKKV